MDCPSIVRPRSMDCPKAARGQSMDCPWAVHRRAITIRPWIAHRFSMGSPCRIQGYPWVVHG
eukprot:6562281-Lingulodinium_polyedra.AAC.1